MAQKKEVKSNFKKALQEVLDENQEKFREKRRQSIYSIGEKFDFAGNTLYFAFITLFVPISFVFSTIALIILTEHLGGTNFFVFNFSFKLFTFFLVAIGVCWFYGWLFKYLSKRGEIKR
jgi:hypothetical protein